MTTLHRSNGAKADNIREVLKNVKMPAGFKIELYALVPDARDMAMAPQGTVLFVGTRKDKVWVVSDRDRNGVADEVKDFAPRLNLTFQTVSSFRRMVSSTSLNGTMFECSQPLSFSLRVQTWSRLT